jgi:hypothetical protein
LGLFLVIIRESGCKIIKYMIILYNTTNMSDADVTDGQVRHIYNKDTNNGFKVTIPVGWVQVHPNQTMHLSKEWVWGDEYRGTPPNLPELPNDIKARFQLAALPQLLHPAPQQGQVRGRPDDEPQLPPPQRRVGGKSKKRSATRRRCSSKRRMSKPRKARATRRK